jgi:hypothetical protein
MTNADPRGADDPLHRRSADPVNALYVAAEFAIVGARATRVEQLAAQGHRLAGALLPILRDTPDWIATSPPARSGSRPPA